MESKIKIHTPLDSLLEQVEKSGKLSFSNACNFLNVERCLLDEWILALEKKGLVRVKYSIFSDDAILPRVY